MDRVQSSTSELRSYEVTRQTTWYASLRSCSAMLSIRHIYSVCVKYTGADVFLLSALRHRCSHLHISVSVNNQHVCVHIHPAQLSLTRFVTTRGPTPVTTTNAIFSLATVMTHFLPHYKGTSLGLFPDGLIGSLFTPG